MQFPGEWEGAVRVESVNIGDISALSRFLQKVPRDGIIVISIADIHGMDHNMVHSSSKLNS
jgi:hypothetical protein